MSRGSWREDKENLTYGRKRFFSALICLSISLKPLCAAAEPGLACLISMVESVACRNLVRGLRVSISRFFDGGLKLTKLAGKGKEGDRTSDAAATRTAILFVLCCRSESGVWSSIVVSYCLLDQGLFIVARRSSPPTVSRDLMK